MLISVHMPKTAGTSFEDALRAVLGERLLRYSTQPLSSTINDRMARLKCKLFVRLRGKEIVSRYEAITGHFVADTFDSLPCEKQFCAFFREPVDRVISHYLYWNKRHLELTRQGLKVPRHSAWRHMIRKSLSINDFAAQPKMANFYSLMLGPKRPDEFHFIGLKEEYQTSLLLFEKIFGIKLQEKRERIMDREQYAELLHGMDRDELGVSQRKNREIYDQAHRRFDQLCAQYL